ncbi:MAG TPA: bifunctional methylenetetrahydrofolate dehydrogenase/methenyltetrahydrofolate cyclohydrolase FolD [Rhodospirillales bacterium]|nr:bifunctional methylenetetrahydrofolate dehydrogenase/methenyltetrahydrofolate cyclohydrolase FolD [Rhodospirillales bacterium]
MAEAKMLDGAALAATLRRRIADAVERLDDYHKLTPGLAVVLVGENPASQIYVRNKSKQCAEVGMRSLDHHLPDDVTEHELLTLVHGLNNDPQVSGILVQLPLPEQIEPGAVVNAIDPAKDVDGFHVINAGLLSTGDTGTALVPCTPSGCMMLIGQHLSELAGLKAMVLGRSNIVGKPMAQLLLAEHCTVTMAHSRTRDLAGECRQADILVAAVGHPRMVKGDWIKEGATVIDVGINRVEAEGGKTRLVGDVAFDEAKEVAGAITPVPGGVGPMTIACLLRNTVIAACRQHKIDVPDI